MYSPDTESPPQGDPIYSHHRGMGFGENKPSNDSILPIKTVEEVIEEAGEEVPWIIEGLLARGALTDFSGLAKKGGKTTFWCHAIVAGAKDESHAGFRTEPARYLYLTEQGNNYAQALIDSGLVNHSHAVRIIQYKDVSARRWETLVNQTGLECRRRGFDSLVVDTFSAFSGLKGAEENDSGPVGDRMRALRLVAQRYDIAAVLIRHSGKDGTPRGSSAFEAEADICVTLSRPEGRHAPSVRRLYAVGRYGEWERNVQLTDSRYISLGGDSNIEFNNAVKFIKGVLPKSPGEGLRKPQILDKRAEDDGEFSASTFDRAIVWLVKQKAVGERQLQHERGKPKVYWLAYKPPEEDSRSDEEFISTKPPSRNGENKSKPQEPAGLAFPLNSSVSQDAVSGSDLRRLGTAG